MAATPDPVGFWAWAHADPERIALVDPEGRNVTYGRLHARCNQLANALQAMGLKPGDGVALFVSNRTEFYEIALAALQIGLFFTPINHYLAAPEISYIVGDCQAKALFADMLYGDKVAASLESSGLPSGRCFVIGGELPGCGVYEALLASGAPAPPAARFSGESMIYTSGTTGKPKGVRVTLRSQSPEQGAAARVAMAPILKWRSGDGVYLLNGPLHHSAPVSFSLQALHLGLTVIMTDHWDAEAVLQLIEKHRVTVSQMVPIHFHRFLKLPEEVRAKYDVSSLESVMHSAAPCPTDEKRAMIAWWGPILYEMYGGTEGGAALVDSEEWLRKPGTVGRPWPGTTIRIVDDDHREVPAGTVGTVYFSTVTGPPKYFNDAEKSRSVLLDDSTFFTLGEMGYVDDDGYLFLVDRKADLVLSGGVNIYPIEIEQVLSQHPKVYDAAVFGIPNAEWGEELKAVIQLVKDVQQSPQLTDELVAYCADRLAKFKIPRSFDYVDELPRGPNGKLYKRQLRDVYWQGRDRKI